MRALAASFLLLAAFDLSPVLVDRAGMAALGLACLALALPAKPRRPLRSLFPKESAYPPVLLDEDGRYDPTRVEAMG